MKLAYPTSQSFTKPSHDVTISFHLASIPGLSKAPKKIFGAPLKFFMTSPNRLPSRLRLDCLGVVVTLRRCL